MCHRTAPLTPLGRAILVHRVLVEGWRVASVAAAMGVSRTTAYKWVARYRADGDAGLADRSSRPHTSPRRTPPRVERQVIITRQQRKVGPHRIAWALGLSPSTVYAILRRHQLPRLRDLDRPTGLPVRYQRERPGELVHLDVKKLGRIPDGGGWKLLGRAQGRVNRDRHRGRLGYDYLHTAIDDRTRLAYTAILADERGPTCARFLSEAVRFFQRHGVTIEAVLTDRALNSTRAAAFRDTLAAHGIRHLTTRPYRPQTNGKVERFHRTLQDEVAYQRLYPSNAARTEALVDWLLAYNTTRPHTALNGQTPLQTLHLCQQRP